MKEQCIAITKYGWRCNNNAIINGYCLSHYYIANKIKRDKKIKIKNTWNQNDT